MRKEVLTVLFLSVILSTGFVNAARCTFTTENLCNDIDGDIVMRVSSDISTDNAHGQLRDYSGPNPLYNDVLCCNFDYDDYSCSGGNKIIGLEHETNSHAQEPGLNTYSNSVCYENFECYEVTAPSECNGADIEVMTLTASTDAHIGKPGIHVVKICCNPCANDKRCIDPDGDDDVDCIPFETVQWRDMDDDRITSTAIQMGITNLKMVLDNSIDIDSGNTITFEVYEVDDTKDDYLDPSFPNDDDLLFTTTVTATIGSSGFAASATAIWLVTEENLTNGVEGGMFAEDKEIGDLDDLYFIVKDNSGNPINESEDNLLIDVIFAGQCASIGKCGDYETQGECENDGCTKGVHTVELTQGNDFCGEENARTTDDGQCEIYYECQCLWNTTENICVPSWREIVNCGTSIIPPGGTFDDDQGAGICQYYDTESGDDCSTNDYFTYSWDAKWTWDNYNSFTNAEVSALPLEDQSHFREDPVGTWRFDPIVDGVHLSEKCKPGSKTVPCPAQVPLGFFGITGAIIAIMILCAYYLFSSKKSKKVKKKKK